MRSYVCDSPEAAARIVALTLVCDGNVSRPEIDVLDRVDAYRRLGLARDDMHVVLSDLCHDLLQHPNSDWAAACSLEQRTVDLLLAEVDDPALRREVLNLCIAVAEADGHVADGESQLLVNAIERWGLQRWVLEPADRLG